MNRPVRRGAGAPRPAASALATESTAAGIYGIIVSAAVMAAAHAETAVALDLQVLFTLVVYWAAERYARLVAERIHDGRRPTWPEVKLQLTRGWAIVTESALPLLLLAVLSVFGVGLSVAVTAALACSTLMLCVAGWAVGRHGQLSYPERVASAAAAGLFGVAMIALKALLH